MATGKERKDDLPPELAQGAMKRGREWVWLPDLFPSIVSAAPEQGYGCLGGQFQFLLPDGGVYEMYWLAADAAEREDSESWSEFATRSCHEVATGFASVLLREADFAAEAAKLERYDPEITALWRSRVVFCAYFVTEAEWRELRPR